MVRLSSLRFALAAFAIVAIAATTWSVGQTHDLLVDFENGGRLQLIAIPGPAVFVDGHLHPDDILRLRNAAVSAGWTAAQQEDAEECGYVTDWCEGTLYESVDPDKPKTYICTGEPNNCLYQCSVWQCAGGGESSLTVYFN